ncbi:phospholipase A1 member A isoform X3 [Mirounga angustirostris]|uniref:phospholipase A1 member A isoform X3 n=1 Tax=Mirounga angustirostris TaxID=9716 RepID=UPI00313E4015
MPPGLRKIQFCSWGLLLWLSIGSAGDAPPTPQTKCTNFQNANLLRGTNLKVQFLLFTPLDPSCGQLVQESSDLQNSGFNATLGTKLLIHGFRALGTKPSWIDKFIGTLLRAANANVIAVDWVYGSTGVYFSAVENVVKLGLEISRFLRKLLVLGVPESSIHIIGVSLGAHVGGMVGHFYKGQLGRITGLDPAGPEYTKASLEERLDPGDARFVEAIHTDADNLGIRIPVGHVDYFVNGGQDQPGCPTFIHAGYSYLICDHMRAVHLYISALENSCPLVAFPCVNYKAFLAGQCLDCFNPFLLSCPRIDYFANWRHNFKFLINTSWNGPDDLKNVLPVYFCVYPWLDWVAGTLGLTIGHGVEWAYSVGVCRMNECMNESKRGWVPWDAALASSGLCCLCLCLSASRADGTKWCQDRAAS